jgi:RNA binding exosome subunit
MENVDRKIFDELFYFKQEVEKELKEVRGIVGELIQVINGLKDNSNKEILMMKDLLDKFTNENNLLKDELSKRIHKS